MKVNSGFYEDEPFEEQNVMNNLLDYSFLHANKSSL
jgi:hypothetical protein